MKNLLIVCTGNICRSPIAEGIARLRAQTDRISHKLYVHSAGTQAVVGSGASRNGQEVMASKGINMRRHVAKQVTYEDLRTADLILVMEEAHRTAIFHMGPEHFDKVMLLSELSGRMYDIPDPIGGPLIDYQTAFARINGIINAGWPTILERLGMDDDSSTDELLFHDVSEENGPADSVTSDSPGVILPRLSQNTEESETDQKGYDD